LLGQISASLAAMHRTVDDYDSMAKREIIKAKQEKAQMYVCRRTVLTPHGTQWALLAVRRRVQKFRSDYAELQSQFERLKSEAAASVTLFLSNKVST
jgi:Golgi SNAP receptor complex protein 2